jgi:hypothetical protein
VSSEVKDSVTIDLLMSHNSREAEAVFKHIDTDGNGLLDPCEMQCRLSDFGVEV